MKLNHVHLRYAPGLPNGLPKVTIGDGFTFIVGPNASGKSTLARTMRLAFWTVPNPPSIDASVRVTNVAGHVLSAEIQSGTPSTTLRKTPMEQGTQTLYKLGLAQLLRDGNQSDKDFAARLQTELHGGVPIAQIRADIRAAQTRKRAPKIALENARNQVHKAEQQNRALLSDENTLQQLQKEREKSEISRNTVRAIDALMHALDLHSERRELQIELAALPLALEQLRSDDIQTKRTLETRLNDAQRARDAQQNTLNALCQKWEEITPAWKSLAPESLDVGENIHNALRTAAQNVQERNDQKSTHDKRLRSDENKVFGGPVERPVHEDTKEALKSAIHAVQREQANVQAHDAMRRYFDAVELDVSADADPQRKARLEEQINALRAWLRTPQHHANPTKPWNPLLTTLLALSAAAMIVATLYMTQGQTTRLQPTQLEVLPWIILVVSIVAAFLSIWQWIHMRSAAKEHANYYATVQADVRRAGVDLPEWTQENAAFALRNAERALLQCTEAESMRQRGNEVRQAHNEAAQRLQTAESTLEQLARKTGVQSDVLTLEAAEVFYRTQAWIASEAAYAEASSALKNAQNLYAHQLEKWSNWLRMHQLQTYAEKLGNDAVIPYAREQLNTLKSLQRDIEHAEEALTREKSFAASAEADMETLKRRLGPWFDSESMLEQALVQRDQRQILTQELASVELRYARVNDQLHQTTHHLADEEWIDNNWLDGQTIDLNAIQAPQREALERAREQHAAQAERLNEWIEEAARLQERLHHARQGSTLEDAHAERLQAEEESRAQAERRGMLRLEEHILEWSVSQRDDTTASDSLTEADRWLRRFTHGRFGLRLSIEGELVGYDVEAQQERRLSQLSDATRVQALLAARLVAIKEAEAGGERLPIVLDEVFSTTDDIRFEAIAGALSELVRNGRQIIYLTANPGEYARWVALQSRNNWVPAHVEWLADLEDDVLDDAMSRIELADDQPVPPPAGRNAQEYARALHLKAPRMDHNAQEWPLLWLLPDALDAVHSAMTQRLVSVGQTLSLVQSLGDEQVWRDTEHSPAELSARVKRRAQMLQAMQRRWSRGVSRAFRWQAVEDSGEVTDAFRERMQALYDQHRHDPETFVNAVGDLPRFQRAKTAALREYFLEQGILAQEAPATPTELRNCALDATDRNALTPEDVAWLESVVASVLQ